MPTPVSLSAVSCDQGKLSSVSLHNPRVQQILRQVQPIQMLPSTRILSSSSLSSSSPIAAPTILDWRKRPAPLQECIDSAFRSVNQDTGSKWGLYNGSTDYCMCSIEEKQLMKKKILDSYPAQKEFYALDIGAGNFQWVESLAEYLDEQTDLPKDIKIHIIGVRGEQNLNTQITDTPRCRIYELGSFKIEEMATEFEKRGLDHLKNKIDMASSRWCLRHLADPVGTFAQIVNFLRPQSGHFMFDGFLFLYQDQNQKDAPYNRNMVQLLLDAKVSFLMMAFSSGRSLNHFVIKKKEDVPCQLPMSYAGHIGAYRYQIGSQTMTIFKRMGRTYDWRMEGDEDYDHITWMKGDKSLHEQLKQNRLLSSKNICWMPIQKEDQQQKLPPLHSAILHGNSPLIRQYLDQGCDINESDSYGRTPLHLSILQKDQKLFTQLLIEKRADLGLYDGQGLTALHTAAIHDTEGLFLQALIDSGADVNCHNEDYPRPTPLDSAIKAKNLRAVQILLKSKAKPHDIDSVYSPLLTAAAHDTEGSILQALLETGIDVSRKSAHSYISTPLDDAIEAKNLRAIEILLKAGACCSEKNLLALSEASFAIIHDLLPKQKLQSRF